MNSRLLQKFSKYLFNQDGELRFRAILIIHLVLTFPLFAPFLLTGKHLLGSADNTFAYFPHLFLNLRNLMQGDLSLWNPYILSGIDFTASTHNYLLSPFNWLLMLVPEEHFFTAFTVRVMLEIWLIGVFGFLAFNAVLGSKKWALFSSITYQLGSLTVLGITLYPATTTLLLTTIAIYLLFTIEKRRLYLSYILLTVTLTTMILSGQLVYVISMTLSIFILNTFHSFAYGQPIKSLIKHWGILFLAGVTSGLVGSLRLLPFYEALKAGARVQKDFSFLGLGDLILFHYFAFVPETFGLHFASSSPILEAAGFKGYHIHGTASFYIGVIPILLIVWSLMAVRKNKPIKILSFIYLVICLGMMNVQPVGGLLNFIILFPFIHPIIYLYVLPIGLSLLAGYIGKYIEENPESINKYNIIYLFAICVVILEGILAVWLKVYPALLINARITLLISGLGFIGYFFGANFNLRNSTKRIILKFFVSLMSFAFIGLIYSLIYKSGFDFYKPKSTVFLLTSAYSIISVLAISSIFIAALLFLSNSKLKSAAYQVTKIIIALLLVIVINPFDVFDKSPSVPETFTLFVIGSVRFIVATALLATLLLSLKTRKLDSKLFLPLLLLIVIVDLVPFNKGYSRIITEPFFVGSTIYPSKEKLLKNIYVTTGYQKLSSEGNNFLNNPNFEQLVSDSSVPKGWLFANPGQAQLRHETSGKNSASSIAFSNRSSQVSNLYQDLENSKDFLDKDLTLGAWVKSSTPNYVKLLLADSRDARSSGFHSGSGQWEWLETHFMVKSPGWVRSHISVSGDGSATIAEVILAETPKDSLISLDLENYRINNPHVVLGISGSEMETNIPTYYGVRSYGGVNSQITQDYATFVRNFDDKDQQLQSGVWANIENERFLDLVGARYDIGHNGGVVIRPNALSRLMLFRNFEVIDNKDSVLARLKEANFNPTETVVLAKAPSIASSNPPKPAQPLKITKQTASRVELEVESTEPAILFFNDSYDKGWKVTVNGKKREVIPADYQFMATTVDAGRSQVIFKFEPPAFMTALKLAQVGILLFIVIAFLLWKYPNNSVPKGLVGS